MRNRVTAVILSCVTIAALMTGCTMTSLPTYDDVRDETESAMQQIADTMPEGSRVEDLTVATPTICGGGADGVFFTGHWFVHGPDGFDTDSFITELPTKVAADFTEEESGVAVSFPADRLRSHPAGVGIDVTNSTAGEYPGIEILATSPCAKDPADD